MSASLFFFFFFSFFFFNDTATTEIYTLSLHDALPICQQQEERLFQLVYFEIEANDSDINGGEPIYIADKCIGITTSGDYGHFVKKSLGFGYVKPDNSLPGTELYIDLLGDRCRATVLKDPIYDPHNERLKG